MINCIKAYRHRWTFFAASHRTLRPENRRRICHLQMDSYASRRLLDSSQRWIRFLFRCRDNCKTLVLREHGMPCPSYRLRSDDTYSSAPSYSLSHSCKCCFILVLCNGLLNTCWLFFRPYSYSSNKIQCLVLLQAHEHFRCRSRCSCILPLDWPGRISLPGPSICRLYVHSPPDPKSPLIHLH